MIVLAATELFLKPDTHGRQEPVTGISQEGRGWAMILTK